METAHVTAPVSGALYGPDPVPRDDPAEVLHEASKLYRTHLGALDPEALGYWTGTDVDAVWGLPLRRLPDDGIALPPPGALSAELSVLLRSRRSRVPNGSITVAQLSTIAWAAYGVQDDEAIGPTRRTVPSAGALYPLGLWCAVRDVHGIPSGLYQYDPFAHRLRASPSDATGDLTDLVTYPHLVDEAAVSFIVSATFWRNRAKYGLRAYRFALLEAGHLGQNLTLAAEALGLAANAIGGFYDRELDELLDLDGVNESVLYLLSVGAR